MNLIVTSLKGGIGKSTSSIYLCAATVGRGYAPVTLTDVVPQAVPHGWFSTLSLPGITSAGAPFACTATRSQRRDEGVAIVDTTAGGVRSTQSAVTFAHAEVLPTRARRVEYARVLATFELIPTRIPRGVVICAARLGPNDLEAFTNSSTEASDNLIKGVKRVTFGFRNFRNCRLSHLLYAGKSYGSLLPTLTPLICEVAIFREHD